MGHKISIIIPCYNCAETVEEAVDSVYRQGFRDGEFEVVMVNDGSVDGTAEVLARIASRHQEITVLTHDRNRGGGAARNSGIESCRGDLVFCLDADNILGDGLLPQLRDHMDSEKVDGAVVERRKYFMHHPNDKTEPHVNPITGQDIALRDLFDKSDILLDNFLFTKSAWQASGGYPEHHGFDTQCFEVRFLSSGHRASVCPNSVFFHRLSKKQGSYFQRVYQKGEFSRNFYLIYEEILHLFSPEFREMILTFDFFENCRIGDNSLKAVMCRAFQEQPGSFFGDEHERYMTPNGLDIYAEDHLTSSEPTDQACRAVAMHRRGDYLESLKSWANLAASGFATKTVFYASTRSLVGLGGKARFQDLDTECLKVLDGMSLRGNPVSGLAVFANRFLLYVPGGQFVMRSWVKVKNTLRRQKV